MNLLVVGASEVFGQPEATCVRIEDGVISGFNPDGWSGPVFDAEGRSVVPGFIDAHTHLIFAGERRSEFVARLEGRPYEAGGINNSVAATSSATDDELLAAASGRATQMLSYGTTTVEVKTGYGLDSESELRYFDLAQQLVKQPGGPRIEPTFLAHLPPFDPMPCLEKLPKNATVDIFCDRGAYSVEQTQEILERAKEHGLRTKLHANELGDTGGAALAAEFACLSADHLLHVSDADADAMAERGVAAVLLPSTSFGLGEPFAPARRLLDAGVTLALGSDCNPGTSFVTSMPYVLSLAVSGYRLSPTEVVKAATAGSASALGLSDRGRIEVGLKADLAILDTDSHIDIGYRPPVEITATILGGEIVHER